MSYFLVTVILVAGSLAIVTCEIDYSKLTGSNTDENEAREFIKKYDAKGSELCYKATSAKWDQQINPSKETNEKVEEAQIESGEFEIKSWETVTSFAWHKFKDPMLKRWFWKASSFGDAALPEDKLEKLQDVKNKLTENYQKTLFCRYDESQADEKDPNDCELKFIPTVNSKLNNLKRSYEERLFYWEQFMDKIGKKSVEPFKEYVQLANEAAKMNGYSDKGEQWAEEDYEIEDFKDKVLERWSKIEPLFKQLHAYVRKMLKLDFDGYITSDGPIPAHVLGGMWAQSWKPLNKEIRPFPDEPSFDVTDQMKAQEYTVDKMVKLADKFFISLGMKPATKEFYDKSIFTNDNGQGGDCMAASWDLCSTSDFRMKICADINMNHFITLHHEMGHIQYYMQYSHQPKHFREAANPALHEAIGDVISLSVQSPEYMNKIGLLEEPKLNKQSTINMLMSMALEKVAFLPSALIFDSWRWEIFAGQTDMDKLNERWWQLRTEFQGLCPGRRRTNDAVDPLAKFHVANGHSFISYYVSYIVQFQIHKELCRVSGHQGPLHECSIYGSREAGEKLEKIMQLGASKPWPEVIMILTDNRTSHIEAEPLLEYFQPLMDWLENENSGETIGWKTEDSMICPGVKDDGKPK